MKKLYDNNYSKYIPKAEIVCIRYYFFIYFKVHKVAFPQIVRVTLLFPAFELFHLIKWDYLHV